MQASGRQGRRSNPPKAFKLLPWQHGSEVRSHCLEARRTDRTPCIYSSLCCCAVQPRGTVPQRSQKPDISGSHPGRGGTFLSARRSTSNRCHSGTKTSDRGHPPPPSHVSLHLGPKRKRSSQKQSALSPDHACAHFRSPSITCSKITETEHTPNTP